MASRTTRSRPAGAGSCVHRRQTPRSRAYRRRRRRVWRGVGDGDDAGAVASQPRAAVQKRIDVLHVGHRPRHADGAGVHDLLHHGLRLRRRRARARASGSVSVARVGVVLAGGRRHADGAVAAIVAFKATVLYTFYPPLQAHPAFYIGLTMVVVGSWGWSWSCCCRCGRGERTTPGGPFLSRCTASWRPSSSGCWPRSASPPRCCSC